MTSAISGRISLIFLALAASAVAQQAQLRVVVVEGEGALNNVNGRTNRDVVVEVRGANASPIANAELVFNLPITGPSGTFANGDRMLVATTNAEGRATASGIRPNTITGPLQIRVAATYQGQTATAVITQTNVAVAVSEPPAPPPAASSSPPPSAPKRGMSKTAKVILILAIAGGAAAGAAIGLSSGDSSPSGGGGTIPPPIIITPGTPGVGGPQ